MSHNFMTICQNMLLVLFMLPNTAPNWQGLDCTRPLKVLGFIWHQDVATDPCKSLLLQHIPQMLDQIEIWGI